MKAIIFIPTYNEKENIKLLIEEILRLGSYKDYGILVVDDNSPDGTGKIVDSFSKKYPKLVKVIHRRQRGRGTAGIIGLSQCCQKKVQYVLEMDADFSHNPQYIPQLIQKAEKGNYDVVVGSRFVPGGKDMDRIWHRKLMSKLSRVIYQLITGLKINDIGSGYKCYKREILTNLPWKEFYSKGLSISMETVFRLKKKGAKICENPIIFVDRKKGKSKLHFKDFIEPIFIGLKLNLILGRA